MFRGELECHIKDSHIPVLRTVTPFKEINELYDKEKAYFIDAQISIQATSAVVQGVQ